MKSLVALMFFAALFQNSAEAGVFNLYRFVEPGAFAIGVEPELTLTSGAGVAATLKVTQGVNELSNFTGMIGTGGGPRQFRVGANYTFDFFPDLEDQPGIGIGFQGMYLRSPNAGQLEVSAIPYIHNTFVVSGREVEPFFSFPFGTAFGNGDARLLATATLGAMIKASDNFRYVVEMGIAVNNTESYFSGGIVYYY